MAPATTWKKGDPLPPKLKHEPFPYCLDCKDPTTPPVAKGTLDDGKTMVQQCPRCGLLHYTGLPESVVGGAAPKRGRD